MDANATSEHIGALLVVICVFLRQDLSTHAIYHKSFLDWLTSKTAGRWKVNRTHGCVAIAAAELYHSTELRSPEFKEAFASLRPLPAPHLIPFRRHGLDCKCNVNWNFITVITYGRRSGLPAHMWLNVISASKFPVAGRVKRQDHCTEHEPQCVSLEHDVLPLLSSIISSDDGGWFTVLANAVSHYSDLKIKLYELSRQNKISIVRAATPFESSDAVREAFCFAKSREMINMFTNEAKGFDIRSVRFPDVYAVAPATYLLRECKRPPSEENAEKENALTCRWRYDRLSRGRREISLAQLVTWGVPKTDSTGRSALQVASQMAQPRDVEELFDALSAARVALNEKERLIVAESRRLNTSLRELFIPGTYDDDSDDEQMNAFRDIVTTLARNPGKKLL